MRKPCTTKNRLLEFGAFVLLLPPAEDYAKYRQTKPGLLADERATPLKDCLNLRIPSVMGGYGYDLR